MKRFEKWELARLRAYRGRLHGEHQALLHTPPQKGSKCYQSTTELEKFIARIDALITDRDVPP